MASNPLNLYATRVFAEHPNSMWALDEQVGYISLITPAQQNFSNWQVELARIVDASNPALFEEVPPKPPFDYAFLNGLVEDTENMNDVFPENPTNGQIFGDYVYNKNRSGWFGRISITTEGGIASENIDPELGSLAIGFYAYTYGRRLEVRLGYSYLDTVTNEEKEVIRQIVIPPQRNWAFISETIPLVENFDNIKPTIEFSYPKTELIYELAINGITVGQWSEEFHTTDLGSIPEQLPENYPFFAHGIPAFAYGLQGTPGYYLTDPTKTSLCAKNSGIPLVFGSSNSTILLPNAEGTPSLVLPGGGFLNQDGQYKPLTFEFWANIQSNTIVDRRIFGPVSSSDGLYVNKHLLKLKIGSNVGSYSVGEWSRPMLISIRLTFDRASLLVNGEEVVSFSVSPETVNYPEQIDINGKNLDWLGFYAYDDVPNIQIEAPAIYPYEVPDIVQKRRFVYGQGVEFPVSISGLNHSSVTAIDYSVANYAKNISYPKSNSWRGGFLENIADTKTSISTPDYKLPELFLKDRTPQDWHSELYEANTSSDFDLKHYSLKPSSEWEDSEGYLYFRNLSFLKESLSSIYGVFEIADYKASKETLLRLENSSEGTAIVIGIDNDRIFYDIEYIDFDRISKTETFYECGDVLIGDQFAVGLNFAKASKRFGGRVASFLGTVQSSKLYVGGQSDFSKTFSGKIFKVALLSGRNLSKTTEIFDETTGLAKDYLDGFLSNTGLPVAKETINHVGTYTLVPRVILERFELDIATDSYWEDYIPLSYFGKYVIDNAGKSFFALDFLQFNFDYPRLERFFEGEYTTGGLPVKTYISFQYLKNGANANVQYFTNTKKLSKDGVVSPGNEWVNTKYEVLDDSIIKLPLGINIKNVAIVFHIEIVSEGILNDKLTVRYLEIASQALGQPPNKINTKFGTQIIPYKKSGLYFEYRAVSPFSIYKSSSPYLYLTKTSGIRSRAPYSFSGNQGLSIPINQNLAPFFKIDLLQLSLRYGEESFPLAPVKIFEIQDRSDTIKFYLVADSNTQKRGQIYAISENTGTIKSGIVYYIDGKVVRRPILNKNTWTTIGLSFGPALDMSLSSGAIRFTSPILFNNVSYYQTTQLDEIQRFSFRKWFAVRAEAGVPIDWGYWAGKNINEYDVVETVQDPLPTWQEVLFLTQADPTLPDASEIYKTYAGTNSIIFDTQSSLIIKDNKISSYKDLAWNSFVADAV